MTRRRDLMLEDITGCTHEPETPILREDDLGIDHWVCRCGRRVATGQVESAIVPSSPRSPAPLAPKSPPLRVGTTAWRVAAPGERLTHEFHLAVPCRPVHVGLIGAALLAVRIEDPEDNETGEAAWNISFRESSVETTDQGIRIDHDLETLEVLQNNLVVFVDFECTLKAKGQVTILLIFETVGGPP